MSRIKNLDLMMGETMDLLVKIQPGPSQAGKPAKTSADSAEEYWQMFGILQAWVAMFQSHIGIEAEPHWCAFCGEPFTLGKTRDSTTHPRITIHHLHCQNGHQLDRYSYYYGDSIICSRCRKVYSNELDVEIIREWGYCISCDHIDGDVDNPVRKESSFADKKDNTDNGE